VFIELSELCTPAVFAFISFMRGGIAENIGTQDGRSYAGLTGYSAVLLDVQESSERDMARMDIVALPVALCVLLFVLRAWPLMLIPILDVAVTTLVSFAIMYPIALWWQVGSFCLAVMTSIVIAISIDYSLFLLSRFKEERTKGDCCNLEAVRRTLRHAGKIVATSGGVLAISVLGIAMFPVPLMSSLGVAAAVSLLTTMVVNLTLTPALLLSFGTFFGTFGVVPTCCRERCCCDRHGGEWNIVPQPQEDGNDDVSYEAPEPPKPSFWTRSAERSTTRSWSIAIVVGTALFVAPFAVLLGMEFDWSLDNMQSTPRSSPAMAVMNELSSDFPMGSIYPYQILAVADGGRPLLADEFFSLAHELLYDIQATVPGFDVAHMTSITQLGRANLTSADALLLLAVGSGVYTTMVDQLTNADRLATHIVLAPDFNPTTAVPETCSGIRAAIDRHPSIHYTFYLRNQMVDENDSVEAAIGMFPYMVLATTIAILVLLAAAFRSLVLPFRVLLTVGMTVVWIYGFGSAIFCTDWFDWLTPSMATYSGFFWMCPICTFPLIVGLGLDYDIFLFSRVAEARASGLSARDAVVEGVSKTGHVITCAGVIMAIAFCGLMASSMRSLAEIGFLLAFSVLFDTFVVRTLLNPAILGLCGDLSYWPAKLAPVTRQPLPTGVNPM
jgi:putative drug exporter of the RND superfamily